MEDIYVKMIIRERERLGVSAKVLCEGICTEDMYYKVESGSKTIDRVSIKRLLARLGVDNGNYAHFLGCFDYAIWEKRVQIINLIEDDRLDEAECLLNSYPVLENNVKNKSRINIENQFCDFMKLQILKKREKCIFKKEYKDIIEKALKRTVPKADSKPLDKLLLSPLEMNLYLEYVRCIYNDKTVNDKWNMYINLLEYIEKAKFGEISQTKIYPKTIVYMYEDIVNCSGNEKVQDKIKMYERILEYCRECIELLCERKSLLYIAEIYEIIKDLLGKLINIMKNSNEIQQYIEKIQAIDNHLNTIKKIYSSYELDAYTTSDCYLYRESGMYSISDVAKIRRNMLDMSQEDLCDEEVSVFTVKRLESKSKDISKVKFKNIFQKLSLYPGYIDMGLTAESKETVELYEKLRYAVTAMKCDEVEELLSTLKDIVGNNVFNRQILARIECLNMLRQGKYSMEEYLSGMQEALNYTVKLENIWNKEKIYLSSEEITILYLISAGYKENGDYEVAMKYAKELIRYCDDVEKSGKVDSIVGIYEMLMTYFASLYGDMGRYFESNEISRKLIKLNLKLRRNHIIHTNLYNIAWNDNECNKDSKLYNARLEECITLSQLTGDSQYEKFYQSQISE